PARTLEGGRFHTRCPFAMDVYRTVDPPAFEAPDGSVATCHLHTEGPQLGGRPVAELPIPECARPAPPVALACRDPGTGREEAPAPWRRGLLPFRGQAGVSRP